MSENYVSVAQVNNYIKNIFDSETILSNICVYGEIGNYNLSNGFAYFNLLDNSSLLPCVMFNPYKFPKPNIGDSVLVTGSISYYTKGGKISFNVNKIMPYGKGAIYDKFLALKDKLQKLGYFEESRKKILPEFVNKIGVVSSDTGAVIMDIINVATRRNDGINIVLYPVKVQGIGCDEEVAGGIKYFNKYKNVDVIIVARGGGSMEDLDGFNSEIIANAIYKSKIPIVSAVGHETDFTICDFVSDLRAPTPSAAAELVVRNKKDDIDNVLNLLDVICQDMQYKLNKTLDMINNLYKKLDDLIYAKILYFRNNIFSIHSQIINKLELKLSNIDGIIKTNYKTIEVTNPHNLLKKGYAKIYKNNVKITNISQINVRDKIEISTSGGIASTIVTGVDKNEI